MVKIDFAKTAKDYAQHRAGFPSAFFDRLEQKGFLNTNGHALDIGTGTGLIAREMARRGAIVTGLDRAGSLLSEARLLDEKAEVAVRYVEAPAEAMGLHGESFDLIVAGQCWHWFDRPKVLQQIRKLLRPGGALVIAHFDWLPIPGSMVEATENLILQYSPDWELGGGTGLYPHWLSDLSENDFTQIQTESFDLEVLYSPEDWRGRIRASAGVAASLPASEVRAFDLELKEVLASQFHENPLKVPHRVWWVTAQLAEA